MKHAKANMWRTQEPLIAPPKAGVRLGGHIPPRGGDAAAIIAGHEARDTGRADKLLRRFSWEDGE